MIKEVSIPKETYLSKEKTVLLKDHVKDPNKTVLNKKLVSVNDFVKNLSLNRR